MQFLDHLISSHPQFVNDKEEIAKYLTNYLAKADLWALDFVWESAKITKSTSWWRGMCCKTKLKNVAVALLGKW